MLGSVESGTENVAFDHVTTARPNNAERENSRNPKTVSPLELPQDFCKIVDDRSISAGFRLTAAVLLFWERILRSLLDPSRNNAAQGFSELCRNAEYE